MSDYSSNDDDNYEYVGPLGRIKPVARVLFGLWGLFGLIAIAAGVCVVGYGILLGRGR
jgi:hypothetical protein